MRSVVSGRDTLAILPTSHGKSAIYQLAASLIPGPTLVVSPLLGLERDQVAAIEALDIGGAVMLEGGQSERARTAALERHRASEAEFLLVSPEQLERAGPRRGPARGRSLADRGRRGPLREQLGPRLPAGLPPARPPRRGPRPATGPCAHRDGAAPRPDRDRRAAPPARSCCDRPQLRPPEHPARRQRFADPATRDRALVERTAGTTGAGIVYTATRRRAETLAEALVAAGVAAVAYHAGLRATARREIESAFLEGRPARSPAPVRSPRQAASRSRAPTRCGPSSVRRRRPPAPPPRSARACPAARPARGHAGRRLRRPAP